jgi:hypothetical protein
MPPCHSPPLLHAINVESCEAPWKDCVASQPRRCLSAHSDGGQAVFRDTAQDRSGAAVGGLDNRSVVRAHARALYYISAGFR